MPRSTITLWFEDWTTHHAHTSKQNAEAAGDIRDYEAALDVIFSRGPDHSLIDYYLVENNTLWDDAFVLFLCDYLRNEEILSRAIDAHISQ